MRPFLPFTAALLAASASPTLADKYWAGTALCRPSETVVFSCNLDIQTVSICAKEAENIAVYRYGKPGHIRLELADVYYVSQGASATTEEIVARSGIFHYIAFTINFRSANPNFDPTKPVTEPNDKDDTNDRHGTYVQVHGLAVQKHDKTIARQFCREISGINFSTIKPVPTGDFIDVAQDPVIEREVRRQADRPIN